MHLHDLKLGILGGGQLGKMICLAAAPWHLKIHILDKDDSFPAARYCDTFISGDFRRYEDVMAFGQSVDIITIEIESVNLEALHDLKKMGKIVHPDPDALEIINDKGKQNEFYETNGFRVPRFDLYANKEGVIKGVKSGKIKYPFVQKARTDGYDGRGVVLLYDSSDLDLLMDCPCVVEELVQIEKELGMIVARNENGQTACFEPVEMVFHPTANLVEFLKCPTEIPVSIEEDMKRISIELITKLNICGLLAVEFFLDINGDLFINEVAPRVHNSGHHTIESARTSQFEQHIRAVLNLPLGDPGQRSPAIMVNLLGAEGYKGKAVIDGIDQLMRMSDVHLHWYGKTDTRPNRKMGHITLVGEEEQLLLKKARQIKNTITVQS